MKDGLDFDLRKRREGRNRQTGSWAEGELTPGGKLRIQQYWKLRDREHRESFWETAETVRTLVEDAIRRQMVSDVPIGAFLSGGLDSTLALMVASEAMKMANLPAENIIAIFDGAKEYYAGK